MNTSIPKNIKRLRQKAGMTQEQLAENMFVTRQTVSLWENGRTQPDIQTLGRLAEAFGVELSEILYGKPAWLKEAGQPKRKYIKRVLFCAIAWLIIILLIEVLYELMLQISIHDWPRNWYLLAGNVVRGLYYYGLPTSGMVFGGWSGWSFRKEPAKWSSSKKTSTGVLGAVSGTIFAGIIVCLRNYLQQKIWRWYFSVWLIAGIVFAIVWSILQLIGQCKDRRTRKV